MTRPAVADPDRPVCPRCNVVTRRKGHWRDGQQLYYCPECHTTTTAALFHDLALGIRPRFEFQGEVVLPLPVTLQPAKVNGRQRLCAECVYCGECWENYRADLPVLCERWATVQIGEARVLV